MTKLLLSGGTLSTKQYLGEDAMDNDIEQMRSLLRAMSAETEQMRQELAESDRANELNLQLLRDARRERDEAIRMLAHQRDATRRVTEAMLAARRERDAERHSAASAEFCATAGPDVPLFEQRYGPTDERLSELITEYANTRPLKGNQQVWLDSLSALQELHKRRERDLRLIDKMMASAPEQPCPTCGALGCPTPCPSAEPA